MQLRILSHYSVVIAVVIAAMATRLSSSAEVESAPSVASVAGASKSQGDAPRPEYNRDIRPILAEHCFACHGPDSAARQADLRLDRSDMAQELGAIVPGEADESELVRRIESDDPDERMPPPRTKKRLTVGQREMLRQWIADGAEYQPHWSLIAPRTSELPDVEAEDWVRNPIDRFVLAKLESLGWKPTTEADRRSLARRVCLDLTGLPPEVAMVEAFVHDTSPNAYEKLVDQLLATAEWGEHRARYWLDYARYADTHGIHFDNFREMWSYRDWVIDAFNANMPFDQFTIESLAGDMLPGATAAQKIASGFNRCNITTNEGGAINEEYLVLYARDRTETTAQVWLGLTAGCAVCHNHKFDPLTQKEFYELSAFFNNTTQAAMDGNVKDTPPIVFVPTEADELRWHQLSKLVAAQREQVEARRTTGRSDFEAWLASVTAAELLARVPVAGLRVRVPLDEGQGTRFRVAVSDRDLSFDLPSTSKWVLPAASPPAVSTGDDSSGSKGEPVGTVRAGLQVQGAVARIPDVANWDREESFSVAAWIRVPANDSSGAVVARMDEATSFRGWDLWVQQRQVGIHLIHAWPGDALKVVARDQVPSDTWVHVAASYDGSGKASGVRVYYDGVLRETNTENDQLQGSTRTTVPLTIGQRDQGNPFHGDISDVRVYDRVLSAGEVTAIARIEPFLSIVAKPAPKRSAAEVESLYAWWLSELDPTNRQAVEQLRGLEQEQQAIRSRGTVAHVMDERDDPPIAFVLNRGEYDQRRDQVTPGTPAFLPPFPHDLPKNRWGLARWLLLPDHPLPARVFVNRAWQEVFGAGLVRTTGDFGVTGDLPSHPELLDWLALEFQRSGWDVKSLYRLLVTSATYRQGPQTSPTGMSVDPQNRWYWHGPRFRMDAEMVRDTALASSGLLVRRLGGPSARPYQPPGIWEAVAMPESNTRNYMVDQGDALYRRSMYTLWKRAAPPASMDIFNAPAREVCTVRRDRTNTPLQALVTLNDEQFVEAARHLATLALLQAGDGDDSRTDFIARRLLARPLEAAEREVVARSLARLRELYRGNPEAADDLLSVGAAPVNDRLPPAELSAWTMLANQLMNLDEVLNK